MAKDDNGHQEIPDNEQPADTSPDLAAEFAALGKKFSEAMKMAWNSEERVALQSDIKDGLDRFTAEVNDTVKSLRTSDVAKKVETGVQQAAEDVKSGKVSGEVRKGMVTALKGLSDALDRMATSFTPAEGDEPKE
nr:hypothetical protein [Anaerolineae bacterium]